MDKGDRAASGPLGSPLKRNPQVISSRRAFNHPVTGVFPRKNAMTQYPAKGTKIEFGASLYMAESSGTIIPANQS